MGLDMYLKKKFFVGDPDYRKDNPIPGTVTLRTWHNTEYSFPANDIYEVTFLVAYWRKANAIHNWFVQNVADGTDDCQEVYVSKEQLQELLDTVNTVLNSSELVAGSVHNGTSFGPEGRVEHFIDGRVMADSSVASECLPTSNGFFFGGTDYDEWYIQDLEHTKKVLEETLADDPDKFYFYYQASW